MVRYSRAQVENISFWTVAQIHPLINGGDTVQITKYSTQLTPVKHVNNGSKWGEYDVIPLPYIHSEY